MHVELLMTIARVYADTERAHAPGSGVPFPSWDSLGYVGLDHARLRYLLSHGYLHETPHRFTTTRKGRDALVNECLHLPPLERCESCGDDRLCGDEAVCVDCAERAWEYIPSSYIERGPDGLPRPAHFTWDGAGYACGHQT